MIMSRATAVAASQTGTSPSAASVMNTPTSRILSASGSRMRPSSDIQPKRFARNPSSPSVNAANANSQSVSRYSPSDSRYATGATSKILSTHSAFGMWRIGGLGLETEGEPVGRAGVGPVALIERHQPTIERDGALQRARIAAHGQAKAQRVARDLLEGDGLHERHALEIV